MFSTRNISSKSPTIMKHLTRQNPNLSRQTKGLDGFRTHQSKSNDYQDAQQLRNSDEIIQIPTSKSDEQEDTVEQ